MVFRHSVNSKPPQSDETVTYVEKVYANEAMEYDVSETFWHRQNSEEPTLYSVFTVSENEIKWTTWTTLWRAKPSLNKKKTP
jgi:hypothetical protein